MSFENHLAEQRRLIILETLSKVHDRTLNDSLLARPLRIAGHNVTRDVIRNDIRYLAENGAVVRTDAMGFVVAELTERGDDHVSSRTILDGVARPGARRD